MKLDREISASVNSEFAKTILHRAAEILAADQREPSEANAYAVLEQANEEFITQEPNSKRKHRIYGFKHLSVDLGTFIRQRYPKYTDGWSPINRWSSESDQATMVQKLREAATVISEMVAERTRNATEFDLMSEKEQGEYRIMRLAQAFMQQQGLTVQVEWEREDPENDSIDYWATIDGSRCAFEITALRQDADESHRKIGDPRSNKSLHEELERLSGRIPKVEDGPEALRAAFDKAIKHGNKRGKLNALNGAKYCLLIHNRQFLYEPSWLEIAYPDRGAIDVVIILHADDLTPTRVWEVIPNDEFGRVIKGQNVSALADIPESEASDRRPVSREAIPEVEEAKILRAIKD